VDRTPRGVACYAHSRPGRPETEWEPLADHLRDVAERAAMVGLGSFGFVFLTQTAVSIAPGRIIRFVSRFFLLAAVLLPVVFGRERFPLAGPFSLSYRPWHAASGAAGVYLTYTVP
jgi:hypothetical protein